MDKNRSKKRRRSDDAVAKAYNGVKFTPIPSSGRPGTPHRFFRESYRVDFLPEDDDKQGKQHPPQIVHSHVNGLAVITAGDFVPETVDLVQLLVNEADVASQSAGNKRKQKAKMLRGKTVSDAVFPKDALATVVSKDEEIQLRCCVWGSVIEVNPNLDTKLLQEDPLLDGYLAVILPSGPFPPIMSKDGTPEEIEVAPKAARTEDKTAAGKK